MAPLAMLRVEARCMPPTNTSSRHYHHPRLTLARQDDPHTVVIPGNHSVQAEVGIVLSYTLWQPPASLQNL